MEPLTIQRDVVKHGVRLDCLIEGMAYSAEREEVRNQRLAGVECVEIAEKTGLPIEQVIDYCRELGLPEVGNCHLIPPNMTKGKFCPVCGKPVLQKVGGVRRFCSKECKDEYERKHYKSNKVKFGLKNCHYAKATFDEDGSVTYAKPVRIPGAVSLSMDANGEIEPFYADNIAYYVVNNNSGYEGDLEIALIPESFLTDIMHEELDGNGVLAENANVELEHFAFLFEFDGDQRHIRHVLYNCVASRPSIEGETNEDSKEVKTDTLNLQATPLANGYVKAKTGTNTTDDVYNKWYDAVYEPQAEAVDTEDTGHTEEPQG